MTIREAWEKKKAAQAAAGQAAARSGEAVAPKGRQPGKLKKLFSKTSMAIAATTMLTAAVAATTGDGSGSGRCSAGERECGPLKGFPSNWQCCPHKYPCHTRYVFDGNVKVAPSFPPRLDISAAIGAEVCCNWSTPTWRSGGGGGLFGGGDGRWVDQDNCPPPNNE